MIFCRLRFLAVLLVFGVHVGGADNGDVAFDTSYKIIWGNDHVSLLDQGREAQLSLDINSGAGFGSKLQYESGFFNMRIKLANKNTAGVVTAFYLASSGNSQDELDFEFLGNKEGKPIILQTNVFANGKGDREQRVLLWFDPSADFHTYKILWNRHLTAFYVDDIPIRVFTNNTKIGVMYPTKAMEVHVSIFNGDGWATDGGQTKINWTSSPFTACFQGFNVDGCPLSQLSSTNSRRNNCYETKYWWNKRKYWNLDRNQIKEYQNVREKYMNYDYCTDKARYPVTPPECASNQYITI
ncbi:hypothetical protein ABFX02_14G056000 [Erythranthe guttata]